LLGRTMRLPKAIKRRNGFTEKETAKVGGYYRVL
jgi:hypothetical protein